MNNLAEKVQRSLSDWKPTGEGSFLGTWPLPEAGWTMVAACEKTESLGAAFTMLQLTRDADAPAGLTMKAWADRVASRTAGLLESLKVYEIDETNGTALLRSDVPQARGTARSYYEVTLKGTTDATLRRYRADMTPGSKREGVAFALTYETIGQVVEGMAM